MHNKIKTYEIFIKDLCVNMYAGIYDFERKRPQRVLINITLSVQMPAQLETIEDVISYEDISNQTREICTSKHYSLLETLAKELSEMCFENKNVISVSICLEKPDIIADTQSVGIKVFVQR